MARRKPTTAKPEQYQRSPSGRRIAGTGAYGESPLFFRARPTLDAMIEQSGGKIVTTGFARTMKALALSLAGSKWTLYRVLHRGYRPPRLLRDCLRRVVPDAFEVRRDEKTVVIYEAEDTSPVTRSKALAYGEIKETAAQLFGWKVVLHLIDRYGYSREIDPEELVLLVIFADVEARRRQQP